MAEDSQLFVNMFGRPIAAAVPHIYLSALPFCPSDSRIARTYGPRYLNVLSVAEGRQIIWDNRHWISRPNRIKAQQRNEGQPLPPIVIQQPHSSYERMVYSVAFFPDGRKLASGSPDRTVRIWDTTTGQALSVPFTGHNSAVQSVAISSDGSQIASVDEDGILRVWDSITGVCPLGSTKAHSVRIRSIVFSPDGSRVVTGAEDAIVKVWNVASGGLCLGPLTGHTGAVTSVAFSLDGTTIASGSMDETVRIWDARTGKTCGEPLAGHNDWVNCIALSADGCYLASASGDTAIRLWDIAKEFSLVCAVSAGSPVTTVSFSPINGCLVSGSGDGALCFWNVRSGSIEHIGDAIYGCTGAVWSVAFAPDGQSVASGSSGVSIKLWKVPSTSIQSPGIGEFSEGNLDLVDFYPESLGPSGRPVLRDDSIIDENGWVRISWGGETGVVFWVPQRSRDGLWWPRNTAVMHKNATKIDFSRFVHGENWMQCRTSSG